MPKRVPPRQVRTPSSVLMWARPKYRMNLLRNAGHSHLRALLAFAARQDDALSGINECFQSAANDSVFSTSESPERRAARDASRTVAMAGIDIVTRLRDSMPPGNTQTNSLSSVQHGSASLGRHIYFPFGAERGCVALVEFCAEGSSERVKTVRFSWQAKYVSLDALHQSQLVSKVRFPSRELGAIHNKDSGRLDTT